ncbi:MAG: WD40/YVTN/BNR-like repeat-containing protein [Acidimicrobiales bacterium]
MSGVTPGPVLGMSFITSSEGWLVTAEGLYATKDGGSSWASLPQPPVSGGQGEGIHVQLNWVEQLTPENAWGITNEDQLFVTMDGGTSWHAVRTPAPQTEGACFSSPAEGLIATDWPNVEVYETLDGGTSWQPVWSTTGPALRVSLSCLGQAQAVLRIESGYSDGQIQGETVVAANGWRGPWRRVADDGTDGGTVDGFPDRSVAPATVIPIGTGTVAAGVGTDGRVILTLDAEGSGHGAQQTRSAGIGSVAGAPVQFGQFVVGSLVWPDAVVVAVASQAAGHVSVATSTTGGRSWRSVSATI